MKNKKVIAQTLFLAFLVIASVFIIKNHRTRETESRNLQPMTKVMENGYLMNEGTIFGTTYHITYQNRQDLKPQIEAAMQAVDQSLSMFNPQSTLAHINDNTDLHTDSLFRQVYTLAKQVYQSTGGSFDPTVAPLVNAWGFGFKNGTMPNENQVDSLRQLVGFDRISLSHDTIVKEDSLIIMDYSAIAKGFAVDHVAQLLQDLGIRNYMVEIGGEVIVHGHNPKGKAWRVGIAKPSEEESGLQEILELQDRAMATSGNYRNYYITPEGKKVAHTIDPHTGYPVQHTILSSTVFAPTCAMADAFATAFMVMGLDEAKKLLSKETQLQVYFIYAAPDGSYATYSNMSR